MLMEMVLGQLPMRTNPHQIKIKPNHCPPGQQSLGLFPHQDNSPLGPLPRNKTTHQDQKLNGGELSSWGVIQIRMGIFKVVTTICKTFRSLEKLQKKKFIN